jgi:hypothetical protein
MENEQKLKELFDSMVNEITDQYHAEIKTLTSARGTRPSFDELKSKLINMDKALTDRAVKIIEIYKKETGGDAEYLIAEFKKKIATTIQDFIKRL